MHIELAPKYEPLLNTLIKHLGIGAHLTNSFNAGGETIILVANKEELAKILETEEDEITSYQDDSREKLKEVWLEGLKSIIRDHLNNRI